MAPAVAAINSLLASGFDSSCRVEGRHTAPCRCCIFRRLIITVVTVCCTVENASLQRKFHSRGWCWQEDIQGSRMKQVGVSTTQHSTTQHSTAQHSTAQLTPAGQCSTTTHGKQTCCYSPVLSKISPHGAVDMTDVTATSHCVCRVYSENAFAIRLVGNPPSLLVA
jgi:hypothetical protein